MNPPPPPCSALPRRPSTPCRRFSAALQPRSRPSRASKSRGSHAVASLDCRRMWLDHDVRLARELSFIATRLVELTKKRRKRYKGNREPFLKVAAAHVNFLSPFQNFLFFFSSKWTFLICSPQLTLKHYEGTSWSLLHTVFTHCNDNNKILDCHLQHRYVCDRRFTPFDLEPLH